MLPYRQEKLGEDQKEGMNSDRRRLSYNNKIAAIRKKEFPMLAGTTYLDHGGTTLAPKSLLQLFSREMQATLLANPHSDSTRPSASALMISQTRQEVLQMFNVDAEHWDVVFTANATASIKLVAESFAGNEEGFDYFYHLNSHTSLVGVRELATTHRCLASSEETDAWLAAGLDNAHRSNSERPTLFAYPAQSNMNGERLPLDWSARLRASPYHPRTYTLLDAAAFVSTSPLQLSDHQSAPDFVALSFYKIFGFPDLGALLIRKAAGHVFDHRKYFGGGTTDMVTCTADAWVARKQANLHSRLEDGTIAIRNILALHCAIRTHRRLFAGLDETSSHTAWLAHGLFDRLAALHHPNGSPVCRFYHSPTSSYGDPRTQGATLAFNIRRSDGSWVGCWHVGAALREDRIQVRTGSLCNPAGAATALGVDTAWLRRAFDGSFRCNTEVDVLNGVPIGMVRVTLGSMTTLGDVDLLVRAIEGRFREQQQQKITMVMPGTSKSSRCRKKSSLRDDHDDTISNYMSDDSASGADVPSLEDGGLHAPYGTSAACSILKKLLANRFHRRRRWNAR